MSTIAVAKPFTLKKALLNIAEDEFGLAVSEVRFAPSVQTATWRGMRGNVVKDQSSPEWSVTIGYAQDLDPAGLSRYLHAHSQEEKAVVFSPQGDDGPDVLANVIISPGDIGASGTDWATGTVTLAVNGAPTFVDPLPVNTPPVVATATPTAAVAGSHVLIRGDRFTGTTGAAGVKFGAVNAAAYTVVDDELILASVPAGAAGAAAITVTHPTRGVSNALAYTRGA